MEVSCQLQHPGRFTPDTRSTRVERDNVVRTAARHGLGGPEIELLQGRDFRTCPDWSWGAPSPL